MGPLDTRRGRRPAVMAEINVTPLVDVMLVLLIIFMVTAPMMTQGLEVDLPEATTKALDQQEEPLVVTITKEGEVYLKKEKMTPELLRERLVSMSQEKKAEGIFLRADKTVAYGVVTSTMADIHGAGFDKLGMITVPAEQEK
ncbi:protein TolR [Desulfobulbus rhabdoformis]|uniref:protein TolR n=1 Tax=Desulfobulbus rhabdoformis TaxID=34032 RepID=UPI0019651186|nr:protein TolR [Desulfobulbus rhabdoformis]MBM9615407.1 protein TolR [Desulfobulbus rhabdoformis]